MALFGCIIIAVVPFGLSPDEWGLACLLGFSDFAVAFAFGWLDWVPGLKDLICGSEEDKGPEE